jgi:uncharacterized membrane protein (DUF2068 family)
VIIGGIGFLASGISAAAIAPLLTNLHMSTNTAHSGSTTTTLTMPYGLAGVTAGMGAGLAALGIAYLVMAYGLSRGKRWAWAITVILSYIGIAVGAVSIVSGNVGAIFTLIINGIVLYYLYRPHVKVFFGKMDATVTA